MQTACLLVSIEGNAANIVVVVFVVVVVVVVVLLLLLWLLLLEPISVGFVGRQYGESCHPRSHEVPFGGHRMFPLCPCDSGLTCLEDSCVSLI